MPTALSQIPAYIQAANLHSSATMFKQLAAAVCTVFGIAYSGYYFTNLACHLIRIFGEPTEGAPLAPSTPGEEANEEEIEQNDHNSPAVVPQPEHPEPVKPQAELPEPQSDMAVRRKIREDRRGIQDEKNLPQQRGDQPTQVRVRVAATPLMKHPLPRSLQNINEELQAERQETEATINTSDMSVEEELEIIREKLHLLLQDQKVEMLMSHLAACKGIQQMTGNEDPQGWHEALEQSQPEMLQLEHKWSPGTLFISSADTDAAQQQEIKEDSLELLRTMVNMENPIMKYIELEILGRGTFGEVCRAFNTSTGGEVAIKKITLQGLIRKEGTINELMVVKMSKNPNIVNYLENYLLHEQLWLVLEYMDGGTLRDIIKETQMSEGDIATVSRECLQGLDFIHSNHMIHRNVKSHNVLLKTDGSVKLADFGLFAQLPRGQSTQSSVAGNSNSGWMAPEIMAGQPYGPKVDVWSFGIVGVEMVERKVPYWNETSPQLLIVTEGIPKLQQPELFSALLHDFLSCCLQTDEARRWSSKELLQHPFVTSAEPASSLVPLIMS
ncbi:hypothetical protein HGM15179_018544, partial [Zosterops borbonicus]